MSESSEDSILSPTDRAVIAESSAAQRSMVIAFISAVVAFISLLGSFAISLYSAHLVGQQNNNAQQQALISLVADIAQADQAFNNTKGNTVSAELTVLGEAEEAKNII